MSLMKAKPLRVGKVTIGGKRPAFILGPCVIESEKFVWRMAKKIAKICRAEDVNFIFKASYDKANRTSLRSFRGLSAREGCEILSTIGRELKIPVTTDVHLPVEADIAGEKIDMLQIPAFLCRQTDLLRAAAETGRAINVKKGQFLAPWDVRNIAEKLIAFGNAQFCFTERGTTFGYNNLVADMRSLYWMHVAGQSKGHKKKGRGAATPTASPGEQSLTNIPLPIGHEAKGLVFPDFDAEGHLRGRFEAGTAHRIDQEHIGFQQLKITTYTPDNQPDLQVDMPTSVLDLKTRILSSQERTTIQRADFNIVGDSVQFDTNTRTGRLIGNVKMVISSKSDLTAKPDEKE